MIEVDLHVGGEAHDHLQEAIDKLLLEMEAFKSSELGVDTYGNFSGCVMDQYHGVHTQWADEFLYTLKQLRVLKTEFGTYLEDMGLYDKNVFGESGTDDAQETAPSETSYTVVRGDTLSKIARDNGVDLDTLIKHNGITNPDLIHVGQVIIIPSTVGSSESQTSTSTPTPVEENVGPTSGNTSGTSGPVVTSGSYPLGGSQALVDSIKDYETFLGEPYRGLDHSNETIGYGHVILPGESYESITVEEAEALLKKDMENRIKYVNQKVEQYGLELNQNQFDGLVDMVYNKGNILDPKESTFFRLIVEGCTDENKLYEAFGRWRNCEGEFSLGVYRRSMDSADMFIKGDYVRDYRDRP